MPSIDLPIPMQFGPFVTELGTRRRDRKTVQGGAAFYAGPGKDILTEGSYQVEDPSFPGGVSTMSLVMSGGSGNDTYKFNKEGWAFIADSGGGKDTVKFKRSSTLNPKFYDPNTAISTILINKRDVLVVATDLETGVRMTGIVFKDPFGKLDKNNKIEKVHFGKKKYSFSKFYKSLRRAASNTTDDYGELYSFSKSTYAELGASGLLNLEGIPTEALDNGSVLGIPSYNNSLI